MKSLSGFLSLKGLYIQLFSPVRERNPDRATKGKETTMKRIVLLTIALMLLGTSCAKKMQEEPPAQKKTTTQERPLKVETTLLNEKYEFFPRRGMGRPIAKQGYLLAKHGETELKIQTTEEFAQLVKEITSPEEALALVRLITSQQIRPFLSDVYYGEVHKKAEPKKGEQENRWFAIEPEQYEAWKIQEAVATEEKTGAYKIERFVASYPKVQGQEHTPAQLLKIWEWVDSQGKYSMEIQEVIAEGSEIQKLLMFTK
jgi:hypothetical protein